MKKGIFQSILIRYMISYAAIMAVLFIGVGIFMNNTYTNTVRQNAMESNINRLGTLRFQHEERLNTLMNIGSQISLSYYISPFKLEEEPMKAYHLKLQLVPYSVTNDFLDQLYLIFNEDTYLYSSTTTVGLDMFVDTMMRYDNVSPDELRALLRSQDNRIAILPSQKVKSILTEGQYGNMVTVFVPLRMGNRFNTGNVMFLISDRKYQQMFAEEIHEPRSTYIFYGNEVLSANRSLAIDDAVVLDALNAHEAETLAVDFSAGGRDYLLIALDRGLYDMRYATVIPRETLQARMVSAQLGFGLFLFALSIPCILLTLYFSRRHTKPIKALRHQFAATSAARDDFEAIQSGFADLMGRNEALQTQLTETLPAQKAGFISSFVKGKFAERAQAVEKAGELGLDIDKPYYLIALVDAAGEAGALLDVDGLIACGEGTVTGYGVQLVAQEHYMFVVFADSQEGLERWGWAVKNLHAAGYGALTVSISNVQTDFTASGSAYLEASTAYDNRFVMGNTHVLRFSDVSAAAKDITPFARTYLEGFRKALRSRDERALNDRIHELFQYLTHTELSLFAFRVIYNNVIDALLAEYPGEKEGSMDAHQYYDVFMLSNCRSIDDLDDILRKLCQYILAGETEAPAQVDPLIEKVVAYMRERYADPMLSMSAIADAYGISPARLSLEFKEAVGMNPSEYLLMLRINKAKALLEETGLSIKDIGETVGYYDASGFIRRFKRQTGMTPAQYRKTVTEDAEKE